MNLDIKKLLADIQKSITIIEEHLHSVSTLSEYKNNVMITDAVERRLAIIGEAMWKADKIDKDLSISDKKKIVSLRHIIIHDYDIVEDSSVWMICKKNLPILKAEVEYILNSK